MRKELDKYGRAERKPGRYSFVGALLHATIANRVDRAVGELLISCLVSCRITWEVCDLRHHLLLLLLGGRKTCEWLRIRAIVTAREDVTQIVVEGRLIIVINDAGLVDLLLTSSRRLSVLRARSKVIRIMLKVVALPMLAVCLWVLTRHSVGLQVVRTNLRRLRQLLLVIG